MFPYHNSANVVFKHLPNEDRKLNLQMQQITTQSFSGQNVGVYFPEVAKLLANPDIIVRKMACWFVGRHCTDSNQSLLVFNSLFGFLKQPNPILRVLALQTLASIPLENQLEYVVKLFMQCLDDKNPHVRRAAVLSCSRVHRDYLTFREEGHFLVGKFKAMTSDPDPLVALNVIAALKEIIEDGGKAFVISKPVAVQITNSLEKFPSLIKPSACHLLASYEVVTPDEALDLMNELDCHMKGRANPSTHSAILNLFLSVVRLHLPHLSSEVIGRFKPSILNHLNFEGKEITYALLRYLKDLIVESKDFFYDDLRLFLCKQNDQAHIKHEKLNILLQLFCPKNEKQIFANISDTFRFEQCHATKLKIVEVQGEMVRMHPNSLIPCTKLLLDFMCKDDLKISQSILYQLVRFDYRKSKALRCEVTELLLDWVSRPEVDRDLATMIVVFFGHFDIYKVKSYSERCEKELLGNVTADDDDDDCDFVTKNAPYISEKEKESNQDETDLQTLDNDSDGHNIYDHKYSFDKADDDDDDDDIFRRTIHKLEDVLKSLNIIDNLRESKDSSISYKISESDSLLLSALLSTLLRHFIRQPAQCHPILIDLFDVCSKVNDPSINNKCSIYKNLLEHGINAVDRYFGEVARLWNC